jgi:ADP-ribosyl-[dinitrogen reductase] hydrolase
MSAIHRDAALDRSIGALLGLAVGDALGAPVEGRQRDSFPLVVDFAASELHGLAPGEWTDDTAMAICLAEALLERGRIEPADLLGRFLRWHRFGENSCGGRAAGVSPTTRGTLETFERTGDPTVAATAKNAGNGCIMRLAPVAIFRRRDLLAARRDAVAQASATHSAEEAIAAAAFLSDMLVDALGTGDRRTVVRRREGAAHPALAGIASGASLRKSREEISSAPRAVDTLEAALWCLARCDGFEAAVIEAVNLGGDADTVGAVTGQLAGAAFGASAIPARWLAGLHSADRLAALAERLHEGGIGRGDTGGTASTAGCRGKMDQSP